jgi:hypothetical protein
MDIPLRMSRWTLFLSLIQSPAVKEHKTVKRYICNTDFFTSFGYLQALGQIRGSGT